MFARFSFALDILVYDFVEDLLGMSCRLGFHLYYLSVIYLADLNYNLSFNPNKPGVHFMGHRQTE